MSGWRNVLDHIPQIMALVGLGTQAIAVAEHLTHEEPMDNDTLVGGAGNDGLSASSAATFTLGGVQPADAISQGVGELLTTNPPKAAATITKAIDTAAVINSVVTSVANHPDVPNHRVASVATSILSGLYQAEPAIFALTRSSAQTQGEVNLGLGLAEGILAALARF